MKRVAFKWKSVILAERANGPGSARDGRQEIKIKFLEPAVLS